MEIVFYDYYAMDILENFANKVFFHGSNLIFIENIIRKGFRVWFVDKYFGRYSVGGILGDGIYITCNWRMALSYGDTLLRVTIKPGTKLLNSAVPPEKKVIDYLKREFSSEILKKSPWKVLPPRKKLTLNELVNLFRYHYWNAWIKDYGLDRDGNDRLPRRQVKHFYLLEDFKKLLVRYGFDGYGNPEDSIGIVVFAGDKLVLEEMIAHIPKQFYIEWFNKNFKNVGSIEYLKRFFERHGPDEAKRLARMIDNARASDLKRR